MKKQILVPVVLSAALMVSLTFNAVQRRNEQALRAQIVGIRQRALIEAVDALQDVEVRLSKLLVSTGAAQSVSLLSQTARQAGEAQQNLLKQVPPELLKADILKYPHHALTAARGDYMTAVSPEFVFVTNRKINIPKVMEQLDYRHIPARFTTAGRMVIATDGKDWYIVQYIDKF